MKALTSELRLNSNRKSEGQRDEASIFEPMHASMPASEEDTASCYQLCDSSTRHNDNHHINHRDIDRHASETHRSSCIRSTQKASHLPQPAQIIYNTQYRSHSPRNLLISKGGSLNHLLNIILVLTLLSSINQFFETYKRYEAKFTPSTTETTIDPARRKAELESSSKQRPYFMPFPTVLFAGAVECELDSHCGSRDKICHDHKCICARDRPIEDEDRCLSLSLLNEPCELSEQCLGNSQCLYGICSCGREGISLYNPSAKIYYCHPKRRLHEECNYDPQCPSNSYCSTAKSGCLCQNGYGPSLVDNDGKEILECLPKTCSNSSSCESEHHECQDGICGKPLDELQNPDGEQSGSTEDKDIYSLLKDLMEDSDKLWIALAILIPLSILLLILILMIARKYYLGYCWTANKKEYEPNNKNEPKSGFFNKNSINNKSFKRKANVDLEDGDDETAADSSNLMNSPGDSPDAPSQSNGDKSYVKVDMNESRNGNKDVHQDNSTKNRNQNHYAPMSPLKSSTSTPV